MINDQWLFLAIRLIYTSKVRTYFLDCSYIHIEFAQKSKVTFFQRESYEKISRGNRQISTYLQRWNGLKDIVLKSFNSISSQTKAIKVMKAIKVFWSYRFNLILSNVQGAQ